MIQNHMASKFNISRGWGPFDHIPIDHQLFIANNGKPLGIGCCKWLWSIGIVVKRNAPFLNAILGSTSPTSNRRFQSHWAGVVIHNTDFVESIWLVHLTLGTFSATLIRH